MAAFFSVLNYILDVCGMMAFNALDSAFCRWHTNLMKEWTQLVSEAWRWRPSFTQWGHGGWEEGLMGISARVWVCKEGGVLRLDVNIHHDLYHKEKTAEESCCKIWKLKSCLVWVQDHVVCLIWNENNFLFQRTLYFFQVSNTLTAQNQNDIKGTQAEVHFTLVPSHPSCPLSLPTFCTTFGVLTYLSVQYFFLQMLTDKDRTYCSHPPHFITQKCSPHCIELCTLLSLLNQTAWTPLYIGTEKALILFFFTAA